MCVVRTEQNTGGKGGASGGVTGMLKEREREVGRRGQSVLPSHNHDINNGMTCDNGAPSYHHSGELGDIRLTSSESN